jgi:ERCC4-type nuclease
MVESYGVDFLFPSKMGLCGVQRKTCADLIASVRGDRMQRELIQMSTSGLDYAFMLVEGNWDWEARKRRWGTRSNFTLQEFTGFLLSVQNFGVLVMYTEDQYGTAQVLRTMESWFNKGGDHDSLLRRPKAQVSPELHILQHFEGISLARAKTIYHHFGYLPLMWRVTKEQMAAVPGLGKVSVEKLGKFVTWVDDYDG